MVAACHGKARCVMILVPKEAKIQDDGKTTALMFAARNGYLECVKILAPLEKGLRDRNGRTALYYSSTRECAEFLW